MADSLAGTAEGATVERTQNARGGYDVYEVVEVSHGRLIRELLDLDPDEIGDELLAAAVLVHVGVYKGEGPSAACWHAVEDTSAPFGLNARAQGSKAPVLVAGTTGRGGLSTEKTYRLKPVAKFQRSHD